MASQGQGLDSRLEENSSIDFRQKLLKIDTSLGFKDVEALKFLCRDLLSHKKLEKSNSALEIFELLLEEDQLNEENPNLLVELLDTIRQKSLLRQLGYSKQQVQSMLSGQRRVSKFRKLLYELSEDIDSESLKSMIFLLPNVFPKTEMTSLSFLEHLEKQDLIKEDDLTKLKELCQNVAPRLIKKIEKYNTEKIPVSQTVTLPENRETETPEEEALSSLLGNMQVCELLQKKPWQNEHRRSNESYPEEPENLQGHLAQMESSASAKGDRTPNGAQSLVSVEMQVMADLMNAETSTKSNDIACFQDRVSEASLKLSQRMEANAYRMDRKHRGHCVIVSNHNFISLPARPGTDKDAESLKHVFQWLGFEVQVYYDRTKVDMEEMLQEYKRHPGHADGDCFVCCILTHGKSGAVYSSDDELILIREIMSHFTAQHCPLLAHKPKLFFIQACQGKEIQPSAFIQPDALNPEDMSPDRREMNLQDSIPVEADFLLGLATVQGCVSFRHVEKGSWYIQSLCNHLKDLVPRHEDILSILTAVNDDVSRKAVKHGMQKQMPQPAFTLRKKLVFPVPEGTLPF